jgi:hypothetical protein
MPCACVRCLEHARALGLASQPKTKGAIRKAFRATAKLWHPDRFENEPAKRLEAEEHFKMVQAAYTQLIEHCDNPVELFTEEVRSQPPADTIPDPFADPFSSYRKQAEETLAIDFHGAHGCYTEQDFPEQALKIIWRHVREPDRAHAMVDLSRHGSPLGDLSQFILFTLQAIYVRDRHGILLLLWYEDLGALRFVDRRKNGKLGLWQRFVEGLAGTEQKYILEIYRRDGTLFFAIGDQADDSVKKLIYHFLQQKSPRRSHGPV